MEGNEKRFLMTVECEDCKTKFEIGSMKGAKNLIVNKKEFKVNEQSIFLTYYDCPSCGRRHFVQIDDETSLDMLKTATDTFVKFSMMKTREQKISKKQLAKFEKTRKDLSDYRTNLMKEYTDKSVHNDETDSDFVLRFSV